MTMHYFRPTDESITTPVSEATLKNLLGANSDIPYGYSEHDGCWLVAGRAESHDGRSVLTVFASSEAAAVYAFHVWMSGQHGISLIENEDDWEPIYVELTARSDTRIGIFYSEGSI